MQVSPALVSWHSLQEVGEQYPRAVGRACLSCWSRALAVIPSLLASGRRPVVIMLVFQAFQAVAVEERWRHV